MNGDWEHSRYLYVKDGKMHFGCINPFCGHGSPALPNSVDIPLETDSIIIQEVIHVDRLLTFEIFLKENVGKHEAGEIVKLSCADHFVACRSIFNDLFAGKEGSA